MLEGCITAIVTPMLVDGSIDWNNLDELVEWQVQSGVSGLAVVGSTGEAAALSQHEKIQVIERVIQRASGRIKIIVGSGTAATATTLEFVQQVNQLTGVDYLMCLVPYYIKPTQDGLYRHFAQVAEASRYPVILYNVPGRTAADLSDATVLRLAHDYPHICGIKDATGDIRRALNLLAHRPAGFSLLSGDDNSCVAFMLCGGDGVISVASNLQPRLFADMCAAARARDVASAMQINAQLLQLNELLGCESNPIPVKWALYANARLRTPNLRLPLTELSSEYHAALRETLATL